MKKLKGLLMCITAAAVIFPAVQSFADNNAAVSKKIVLCCEEKDRYPFLYVVDGDARGMMVDIVRKALERLGYEVKIETYPLKRCLRLAEHDKVDGIVSVEYDRNFARFLEYPPGASNDTESKWRIMQIDQVVVTSVDSDYEFNGNLRTLPQPVLVTANDPIASSLREEGLDVEEANTDRQNFAKLIRGKKGCAITTSVAVEAIEAEGHMEGLLSVQALPLKSRSYYLAFSWGAEIDEKERKKVWDEIQKLRSDYVYMLQLFARY